MNYIENILPIGSVVMLEGGTEPLMIIGYYATAEDDSTVYDYTGVLFPDGIDSSDEIGFFNHSQIRQILSLGYKNNKSEEFFKELKESIQQNS